MFMEIILTENQMRLLSEELGVARATIPFVNLVYSVLEPKVDDFIKGTDKKMSEDIVINFKDFKYIYRESVDDFLEFPVEEIIIKFTMDKLRRDKFEFKYSSGGGAHQIDFKKEDGSYLKKPNPNLPKYLLDEVNKTIVAKFDFNGYVNQDFEYEMKDELYFDLRDTIMHEFNHIYEFYNKNLNNAGLVDTTLSYAGSKNYNVPKQIFNVWSTFLYFVYYSEPYEMRAMSQEAYSKRLRMTFDEFKETKYWKAAKMMENFDANKLFDTLMERINEHNPEYLVPIMNRLFKWFLRDYYAGVKTFGNEPKKYITNSKHLLDLMVRFQPRIRMAGRKLQRNYSRLYTLSPE
jgi:hypothetical protein